MTIRPIPLLTGAHHFNEVVFDEVFVPDAMVLGEIGAGWHQVTSELAFERSGPERFLSTYPLLAALVGELGRTADAGAAPRGRRAGGAAVDAAADVAGHRGRAGVRARRPSSRPRSSRTSAPATRTRSSTRRGCSSPIPPDPGAEPGFARLLADAVLHAPGFTLRGGTNEVLRGIVARGLGLR